MMDLRAYIAKARARRLRYGQHDCVTFAGRWAEQRSGRQLVPRYRSLREGRALLIDDDLAGVLEGLFQRIAPLAALPGDLALLESDGPLPALGIVARGGVVAAFVGRQIGFVPLTAATACYRVR